MNFKIDDLYQRFVEAMANFSKEVGIVGSSEGRLLAYLILSDEPLTQDHLMEQSGSSRGNVSTALRALLEGGFIRRVTVRGERKEYYQAKNDLWKITIRFVLFRIGNQIDTVHSEFESIKRDAAYLKSHGETAREKHKASKLLQRVERLSKFTKGAKTLLNTVSKLVDLKKEGVN